MSEPTQDLATVPVQALASPVPAPIAQEKGWAVDEYIKPSLIRYPHYSYKTGTQMFLSKTETILADAYLKVGQNVEAAVRVLNQMFKDHGSPRRHTASAAKRWLAKPWVAQYVAQKLVDKGKVNWMDKDKWESWGVDVMEGVLKANGTQMNVWKEYGKCKGWYVENSSAAMHVGQIYNFVQNNGKA